MENNNQYLIEISRKLGEVIGIVKQMEKAQSQTNDKVSEMIEIMNDRVSTLESDKDKTRGLILGGTVASGTIVSAMWAAFLAFLQFGKH